MQLPEEILCETPARRDADEVGDIHSDGWVKIWGGEGGRRRVETTRLRWVYVGVSDSASTISSPHCTNCVRALVIPQAFKLHS